MFRNFQIEDLVGVFALCALWMTPLLAAAAIIEWIQKHR